jgi:WD40 repeat protein
MDGNIEKILTREYFKGTDQNLLEVEICNQNINWKRVMQNREILRTNRNFQHRGHRDQEETDTEKIRRNSFHIAKKVDVVYQFKSFIKEIPLCVSHFQLRKNFKFLNDKELIYIKKTGIERYNIITNAKKLLVPFEEEDYANQSKVVCFDSHDYNNGKIIIVCGRIDNCVIVFHINSDKVISREKVLIYKMGLVGQIVNYVEIFDAGRRLYTCCNDGKVRIHDLNDNKLPEIMSFDAITAVNHLAHSEDLLAVVGDFKEVQLFDIRSAENVVNLHGHSDFGFACQFKPGQEYILATGNQDYSCKLWDIRLQSSNECFKTLYGYFDSIGELKFEGEFLVFTENMDFLHVYNMGNNSIQTLSYFGHSIGFTCKYDSIYLGIYEYSNYGIMIFDKIRNYKHSLNNMLI